MAGERLDEVGDGREPILGLLLHRALDRGEHGGRRLWRERREVGGLLVDDLEDDLGDVGAGEGGLAGEHLVDDGAEREDVGALVDLVVLAGRLLGRHVLRRAEQRGLLRLDGLRAADLGDAEVEDLRDIDDAVLDLLRHEEDVLRLEVAVDDAFAVRGGERAADLAEDRHHAVERERAGLEVLRERRALEVLEHEVGRAVGHHVVVGDADDVRMAEPGGDLGLALEAAQDLFAGEVGVQELDRDLLAGQPAMRRQEDRAHAATADQGFDRVGLGDHRPHIDARPRR